MVQPHRPLRVALTGGIATGKSHVREAFERLGIATIDSDRLAREAVAPGSPALDELVARFGRDVLTKSGTLDRQQMATRVFADAQSRATLEAVVHPEVHRMTEEWFAGLDASSHPYVLAEIPLLYEAGRDADFDVVIVAACNPELQLARLMARDGLTEADARRRLAAQLPLDYKIARAHHVIRTDDGFEDTNRQVSQLHGRLLASR